MDLTNDLYTVLVNNGYKDNFLKEKVHIALGMIDNLCYEVVYHKHNDINYEEIKKIVTETICNLLEK